MNSASSTAHMRAAAILGPGCSAKDLRRFQSDDRVEWLTGLPSSSEQVDIILLFGGDGTIHRYLGRLVKLALPVLVVPVSRPEIRRILICSGGGTYIEAAVKLVIEFAPRLGASVTLFTALPEAPVMVSDRSEPDVNVSALLASDSVLGRNLRAEKGMIEAAGIPTEVRVRSGLVAAEIAAEIETGDYDLVVLGSKPSRDVFSDYLLGNMTRRLVNWVPRPVLVVASGVGGQRPRSWLERITGRDAEG